MKGPVEERDLVPRLLAGDEDAFRDLLAAHHTGMVRLARSFVRNPATAEEVVQETWLQVLKGLEKFEGWSTLKSWIFSILSNRARTRAVRNGRTLLFSDMSGDVGDGEPAVDPSRFNASGYWDQPPRPWDDLTPERLAASGQIGERLAAAGVSPNIFPAAQAGVAKMLVLATTLLVPSVVLLAVVFAIVVFRGHPRLANRLLAVSNPPGSDRLRDVRVHGPRLVRRSDVTNRRLKRPTTMMEVSMLNRTGSVRVVTFVASTIMVLAGPAMSAAAGSPDTAAYARVLERFVTTEGRVRYSALRAEPADLDGYLESLAPLEAAGLEGQSEADRIAFWINAYNAITLKTIIRSYPINGSGLSAMRYPASSIRQISDAWTGRSWVVAGKKMSLDDIEHKTLRKRFREPRVHMALVCAAVGCPPLRSEAYVGARLGEQLDDQTRRYLASPSGMKLEPGRRRIAVSAIFKWFDDDFDSTGGVREFLARHAPETARDLVADSKSKIIFLDYDWSLNEAQGN